MCKVRILFLRDRVPEAVQKAVLLQQLLLLVPAGTSFLFAMWLAWNPAGEAFLLVCISAFVRAAFVVSLLLWACVMRCCFYNSFYKKLKNVSCEYNRLNGWNSTLQAAWYSVHQMHSYNMVFVNWNVRYDNEYSVLHKISFARVLCFILMKDIGRWLRWILPGSTGRFSMAINSCIKLRTTRQLPVFNLFSTVIEKSSLFHVPLTRSTSAPFHFVSMPASIPRCATACFAVCDIFCELFALHFASCY